MLKNLFRKREYVTVNRVYLDNKSIPNIPDGKWINCNKCKNIIYTEDLQRNHNVCINCGFHFKISSKERVEQIFDEKRFT